MNVGKDSSVFPHLERSSQVQLLRVLAEEGPGGVQLDEVDVAAGLLRHLLK